MDHAAGSNMRQGVGGLTATILGTAILAFAGKEDFPKEEIMNFQCQSGPQRSRIGDNRPESGKLSKRRQEQGLVRRKTSIDRGVWQFNSGDAIATAKVTKLRQEGEALPVRNHQQGRLRPQLPQALKESAQRLPLVLFATDQESTGIDTNRRQGF